MESASDSCAAAAPSAGSRVPPPPSPSSATTPTPRDLLPHIPIGHPDSMMSEESVRRAVEEFETRPTDVIVATFPKTGTTLVTWICHLLRTKATPIEEQEPFETLYEVVPWPTLSWDIGYDPNVQGSRFEPRVFKSHLRMASVYPGCKYVVTVRDPAGTTLSFYNFFLAKRVPFLVEESGEEDAGGDARPKMDVSTFLVDTPFLGGSPRTPASDLRPSIWDYYAEYHALLECPSVLILVYEDFLGDATTKCSQIRRLSNFIGTGDDADIVDRVAAMSTKEYMARHMSKFDEPYERARALGRAADVSQLAPGAKVALRAHEQTLDERAEAFLEDRWRSQMGPLGYKDYRSFAAVVRERNERLFGRL